MTVEPNSPNTRPFMSTPDPQRYFPAEAVEDARQRLLRAISRQEGPALICGTPGVGKTLLLSLLAEHFAGELSVVQLSASQLCSRRELLQAILFQLDLPYRGLDDGELRLSILTHLRTSTSKRSQPVRMLLLVDEAESLSIELLEELRGLSNLADRGVSLTSLVLAGAAAVEEQFADARLDGFSQRMATRCYLRPLGREETFAYLRAQIASTGQNPDELLTSSALEAIYTATDGVPRLINQIGDQLLWILRQGAASCLDAAAVQQVWSELQQLPAPWDVRPPAKPSADETVAADVVEFGPLDDIPSQVETADDSDSAPREHSLPAETMSLEDFGEIGEEELPSSIPFGAQTVAEEHALNVFELEGNGGFIDPFGEAFDEEESLDNRYAAFESQMLRSAPHVRNQLDAAFAADLSRAGVVADINFREICQAAVSDDGEMAGELGEDASEQAVDVDPLEELAPPSLPLATSATPPGAGPIDEALLVVEDDGRPAAEVVPSTQFRRLFSQLESAAG